MKPAILQLWPGDAPGSEGLDFDLQCVERSADPAVRDRAVSSIRRPTLTVFRPAHPNGCGVLLTPGGGYQRIVLDKEGEDIAQWLNALGVTVFLLQYRLPAEGHNHGADVPLQDAQRALRLIRQRAAEWGLDHVGALGFSAGGHVAAMLATCHVREVYAAVDAADALSARPDFVLLGYPVISMDAAIAHAGSRQALLGSDESHVRRYSAECQVNAQTPPLFIFLPDDDASVLPENSVRMYLAARHAGVSAELHSFQRGSHGFGIRFARHGTVAAWTGLAEGWLRQNGWLPLAEA
ncbi:alpha/beta hydrolase [Uliginosibacterium sp. H1]|uniref:alpha/beta hydrolase n=1 Tax=Uliginosibacterium sp. H1 TaxID=3114757 RepID=UPI002E19EF35|nr:alpha/beta hydrolase [Uliginosibacterium sp. H1]